MFLQWSAALQDRSNKTVFDCRGYDLTVAVTGE